MVAVLALRPINLADLSTHLKLGALMVRAGSPYLVEPFAAEHLGRALTPSAWLGQGTYAVIYGRFGWPALKAFDAAVWFSGLLLGVAAARKAPALGALAALAVGYVVALPTAEIRPQSFASLAFGLTLLLLRRADWRAVLLSIPLFVAWQNLHPSVTVAVLTIGAVAAPRWLLYFRHRERAPLEISAMGLAAALATFATPAGAEIIAMASYNAQASMMAGASEWFPIWAPLNRPVLLPIGMSALLVAVFARPWRWSELAPVLVTFVLTLIAVRFILFYAIALVPFLASRLPIRSTERIPVAGLAVTSCVLGALALLVSPVHFSPSARGAAAMRAAAGTIFADPNLGGLIENAANPVAFDGRFSLYAPDELARLWRTQSDQATLAEIERAYRPVGFALMRFRSPALIEALRRRPGEWRQVFADDRAVYFLRADR